MFMLLIIFICFSSEWEKLFAREDYLKYVKSIGLRGGLRSSRFRSVAWKVNFKSHNSIDSFQHPRWRLFYFMVVAFEKREDTNKWEILWMLYIVTVAHITAAPLGVEDTMVIICGASRFWTHFLLLCVPVCCD